MIYKFIRDDKKRVFNLATGRPSNEYDIKTLLLQGKWVIYRDKKTGEDLVNKLNRKIDDEKEGPVEPEFTAKIRNCRICHKETINYFKCSDCWSLHHQEDLEQSA